MFLCGVGIEYKKVGIGTIRDERAAIEWFRKAAEHGDKRAKERLKHGNTGGSGPGADSGRREGGKADAGGGGGKKNKEDCLVM